MSWLDDVDEDDEPEFDESDVRVRPNPKANRPRTKRRPAHEDAVVCRVLGVDRGRYTVLVDEDGPDEHPALATRARELRRTAIVTGDRARVVGDTSGTAGTLARIVGTGVPVAEFAPAHGDLERAFLELSRDPDAAPDRADGDEGDVA